MTRNRITKLMHITDTFLNNERSSISFINLIFSASEDSHLGASFESKLILGAGTGFTTNEALWQLTYKAPYFVSEGDRPVRSIQAADMLTQET